MSYVAIESFDYFVNKVCSVHTVPTNWNLNAEKTIDYFVGIVNSVNECGVCLTNVVNGKKTFIMTPSIIAIAEETLIETDDPEDKHKSLQEYEEKKMEMFKNNPQILPKKPVPIKPLEGKKPIVKVDDSPFVDLSSITAHAKAAKERFKK